MQKTHTLSAFAAVRSTHGDWRSSENTAIPFLLRVFTLGLFLVPTFSGTVFATAYTFTLIADTSGAFDAFSSPSVNNDGTVVFEARLKSGESGIFKGAGGATSVIADSTGPFKSFDNVPTINDFGVVAFGAELDAGVIGIFESDGISINTIADSTSDFSGF